PGPGNLAVLFGSATGRDGIGGASVLASATFGDADGSKRPSVQVGDPFAEKLLIEASLELIERGLVEGLQDLGAAGITCATSETADRAGTGIDVDLDAIPRREPDMAPFEVMISESQERMLAIVTPARIDEVAEVCARWGLPCAVIGRVTDDGDITIRSEGRELARVPAAALTSDAIVHERLSAPPERRRLAPAPGAPTLASDHLPERGMDPGAVLIALLGSPNLASRRAVFEQYDSTVQAATAAGPTSGGAAILRVQGTGKALVAATDGNAGVSAVDPWLGAAMSVAEATRNVAITGAKPLGVTNCLNYGDPTRPDAFWQLAEGVRGLSDACRVLGLPVTGGNVSLYNESARGRIAPTPQIGVVGLLDDIALALRPAFREAGDAILLVGEAGPGLAGSEYARIAGVAEEDGPPALDLDRERRVQAFIREAAARELLASAQDVSGGGFAVALAEAAMWGSVGAHVRLPVSSSPAVDLFGESPSRLIVSAPARHAPAVELLARQHGLPVERIGLVGGTRLVVELAGAGATGAAEERGASVADAIDVPIADLTRAWEHGLPRALGWDDGGMAAVGATAEGR
ncbi:MAG TPA: AIR synthase-related protein, partial [Candidatus Limnocylindria bacterium]|nr:AIR synthase-related protein [Candidatus Limnocylindria bacterium]